MSAPFRTLGGGRIDRSHPISFTFDGRSYQGFTGDTLASALLANGVHLVGRSFKYHRPRGLLAAGSEEPNALVTIDRGGGRQTPNLRATQVELYADLAAYSQNRWPSLAFDLGSVTDRLSWLLPAGFYYKTFMGPRLVGSKHLWPRVFEPLIRRSAGLGHAPSSADPDRYASRFAHCDVLTIGAGACGLVAARSAAETGARVIICDEQSEFGGGLLSERGVTIDGVGTQQWIDAIVRELAAMPNVTLLRRTQAFGAYAQNFFGLAERLTEHLASPEPGRPRERLWQVRAKQVVLATGAFERPLVFPDNDRPGIMLASAAQTYLNRYGVRPGRSVVIVTSDNSGYAVARDLEVAGIGIAAIADLRKTPGPAASFALTADPRAAPAVDLSSGHQIFRRAAVLGTIGRHRVSGIRIGITGLDGSASEIAPIACDLVLMAGGWTPNINLFAQSRGALRFDAASRSFLPGPGVDSLRAAGACNGTFDSAAALAEADEAGRAAAHDAGFATPSSGRSLYAVHGMTPLEPDLAEGSQAVPQESQRGKAFIDFQNDVTAADILLATREGFRSIEHIKRYTTTGMATDQGKTSNMNALAIAAQALAKPIPTIGLTTFRAPYTPVTFGTLAGMSRADLFDPIRRTPIDDWARDNGAIFENVGLWQRARYFPRAGEDMHAAVARECRTVRNAVGVFDASTLGKIEVAGPDAAEFLERIYVNSWKSLGVGRCRYGILLNEAGFIIDDGVVGRVSPDAFHVTTTTGGAQRVLQMMEDYRQTEFPDLEVWTTSTTEQWAVIAVQGPRARELLSSMIDGIDLSADAFPHMALREGTIRGVEVRLFRVSFTGELGFEINVPAGYGRAIWDAVTSAAQQLGGCAYGTEAMHVLRAEKGFIIVGQETDGTVTPDDAGLSWTIGKHKRDFVGKRSLRRSDMVKPGRKQLVGLRTADPNVVLEDGAQITDHVNPEPGMSELGTPALGHVTSAYWSSELGRSIALALVADGRNRMGQHVFVPMPAGAIAVEVVSPVFVDPKGKRLDA